MKPITENLKEPSSKIPRGSQRTPQSRAKVTLRSVFGIAILLLCFLGIYLWKFAQPSVREVKLDLKNGYALSMQIPSEWTIDEDATKTAISNQANAKNHLNEQSVGLVFKRSKSTGLHSLFEKIIYRGENLDAVINFDCLCQPNGGYYDPKSQRDQEMMHTQKMREESKQINRGILFSDAVFTKYDSLPIGYGFEIENLPSVINGVKSGAAHLGRMYFIPRISIFSLTPDKKLRVWISINLMNQRETQKITSIATHLLASNLKFDSASTYAKQTGRH